MRTVRLPGAPPLTTVLAGAVAAVVGLAPGAPFLMVVVMGTVVAVALLLGPMLSVVLAAFAPLVVTVSDAAVGPVTAPRLLAGLLVLRVLAVRPERVVPALRALAPMHLLFAWLAVRSLHAPGGVELALDLARMSLLATVVFVLCERRPSGRIHVALALAASCFLLLNVVFGQPAPGGERWQGLTANPNQLAAVVAVCAPLCFSGVLRTFGRALGSVLVVSYAALAASLIVRTGSREGAIAFALSCFVCAAGIGTAPRRSTVISWMRPALGAVLCALVLWQVVANFDASRLDAENLETLAGRTSAYEKAWHAFLGNPFFGAGNAGQFAAVGPADVAGSTSAQSAHNSYLSVLGQGGLVAAGLGCWVVLSVRPVRLDDPLNGALASSLVCLAVVSLAGDFHLLDLTWVLYAASRVARRAADDAVAARGGVAPSAAAATGASP